MTFKQIELELIEMFDINPIQKSRDEHILKARYLLIHCFAYYSSEIKSIKKIANYIGYSQHGTVLNALQEYEYFIKSDKTFKNNCDRFIQHLLAHENTIKFQVDCDNIRNIKSLEYKIKMFRKQLRILQANKT